MRARCLTVLLTGLLLAAATHAADGAGDWPQLAGDPGRTSGVEQGVAPPFRARWIWCGPEQTLRNRDSQAGWTDDIGPRQQQGPRYPLPESVGFTFSGAVTPVAADGRVFIGDMEGKVYAIDLDDGRTLWTSANPGGTAASAAVADGVVVVTSLTGAITGYDAATGRHLWRHELAKAVTCAPLVVGGTAYAGGHDGKVYAIDLKSGTGRWTADLGAPIVGGMCGDAQSVYVGAEDMWFYRLDAASGEVKARTRLNGQSFRMEYPVLADGRLFVQTVQPIVVGSEYVMEEVMADSEDMEVEQDNILRWLQGDTNAGRWRDASPAWKHLYVLDAQTLAEPYTVPNGPADGCGNPCPPPAVAPDGRVLTWFKTRFPTLTKVGSFGTRQSMDISAIDLATGRRLPIDNGRLSGTGGETDNLFALTVGGPYLYLRQTFRGTKVIDLRDSRYHMIQAGVWDRDGGRWPADVVYVPQGALPNTPQAPLAGRPAVVIAGENLLIAEPFCVTCIEHSPN